MTGMSHGCLPMLKVPKSSALAQIHDVFCGTNRRYTVGMINLIIYLAGPRIDQFSETTLEIN